MLKNLANEINNLLLDNEGKTQEILSLNSNIDSLNITIGTLQNENQNLLSVKVELTNRILELEEQIVNVEANKELENIIVELNDQILSLNAEKEILSQVVTDLQAQLENSEIEANLKLEEVKTIVEELKELIANA
jgi:chromosome segregation ATPase